LHSAEALRLQNLELQAHVEELDAFAHTVAHDIKGSLGPVIGFASVLRDDYARLTIEDQQKCLDNLVHAARKLNNVVDELLLLAEMRKTEVVMEPLSMASIVAEAQQRLAPMIQEYGAEIVLPAAWPAAEGHGPWVEEIWVNYLGNAIKYGGQPPRLQLGAQTQPDGMARFWVRDNGRGLTPEEQARLFKPFVRLDRVRANGHGLGLSVVRHIVEKLGGQVGVSSAPGQGSEFSFTLRGCSPQIPLVGECSGERRLLD
jgi:signal transduction histidine kinase